MTWVLAVLNAAAVSLFCTDRSCIMRCCALGSSLKPLTSFLRHAAAAPVDGTSAAALLYMQSKCARNGMSDPEYACSGCPRAAGGVHAGCRACADLGVMGQPRPHTHLSPHSQRCQTLYAQTSRILSGDNLTSLIEAGVVAATGHWWSLGAHTPYTSSGPFSSSWPPAEQVPPLKP
jgi:hypothetical protein